MNCKHPFRCAILAAFALGLCGSVTAQVRHPGQPVADRTNLPKDIPTVLLATPDVATLMAEDEARGHRPLRYGEVQVVNVGTDTHGRWDGTGSELVWRVRILSPGAYTLGLTFSEFRLPVGGQVFIYDDSRSELHGAYDHRNHKDNGQLGVEPVGGDALIVEYVQQSWVTDHPSLRIGEVIHDYRNLRGDDLLGTSSTEGACRLYINCPAGAPYQTVKRASFRTLAGGGLCSGALLNNTAQNGAPHFLTANHCGSMTNAVFLFNYEYPNCGSGATSQSDTVSGANLRSASSTWDSQLYTMSPVPSGYNAYFAGWNRGGSAGLGSPAAGIGHGAGAPKNMHIDNTGPVSNGSFWLVISNQGDVTGGNSGGPLFSGPDQLVVGPLCCGGGTCTTQSANYGKLQGFWSAGGGISSWLDPLGTGQTTLLGFDPASSQLTYCTSGTTAGGCRASISGTGTPSGSSGSGFDITVAGMDGTKNGMIFYSVSGPNAFQWGNGTSYLCTVAPTQRSPVQNSGGTNGQCDGQMTLDWNAYIASKPNALGNPFLGGEVVWAQGWFRDPGSAKNTSLSNGLQFPVNP